MSAELRVVEDPAAAVAGMLAEASAAGGQIVVTGGSSPRTAFEYGGRAGARLEQLRPCGSPTSAASSS